MQHTADKHKVRVLPSDFNNKIELDKVLDIIAGLCKGEEAKQFFRELTMLGHISEVQSSLDQAKSYFSSFQQDHAIPTGEYFRIEEDLYLLSKENYLLEIEALFRINASIRLGHELIRFFKEQGQYPLLSAIVADVPYNKALVSLVDKVLDEEGKVRPNASPELMKISRRIQSKMRELDKEFDQVLKHYKGHKMLTENPESYRNGRRVLAVPAEKKRQIQGVIHDESATGKTVFIEPESLIRLNQDLFNFQRDYKQEVNRILRQLCNDLRAYLPHIHDYHKLVLKMDVIGAKARWARLVEGEFPQLVNSPNLNFKDAYHPLLKLKNDEEEKPTIPFQLNLHTPNRILLVSGPNAGGKSILMKAVILLQSMVQCGIPIPVHPDSKPGFFKRFMADIGDQQSIENDLSTYSSRLKIMAEALELADRHTLIVIDEFGSGTDPKFGGALAESMLNSFNRAGVYGVMTTHYSNLKIFAYKAKGIVNAAMIFDQEALLPTYQMRIDKPGSSFAYEIADKSGIPKDVMKYARHKTGKQATEVENLLVDLQREKGDTELKLEHLDKKERDLDRLIKNYNNLHRELEVRRKRMRMEAKSQELQNMGDQNKRFENLIRELKEEKNLEAAKEKAAQLKEERSQLSEEMFQIENDLNVVKQQERELREGDFVKILGNSEVGKINWIRKKKAEVLFGNMAIVTKLQDLVLSREPIEKNRKRSVRTSISTSQTLTKLDLRGMTAVDASRMTEEFFDKAILSNAPELTIIHGIGTGALKKIVRKIARDYKDIQEIFHPPYESGGEGVTIIKL